MTTFPSSHHDLLGKRIAFLATVGKSGYPQVTAVWFLFEDGRLRLSLNSRRQKLRNLRERPQCSLVIPDPRNSNRYLEVRASAEIEPDDDYAFADRVGAKYGTDLRTRDRPGASRVVVTLEPVKLHAIAIEPARPW
jgi:PPOX class probable F420-dependent enzyme